MQNFLKFKKASICSLILGFIFLVLGLLIISNKDICFAIIDFISNIRKISPYDYVSSDSTLIYYNIWLKDIYLFGYIIIIISLLNLLFSLIVSFKLHFPKIYFFIFIFFFTLIVSSFFLIIGADPRHDGILLKPAIDVAGGKILFKESFTQYGALTTYLQSFSILIFGQYLIVIRLLTALFYALISILLYLIFSRILIPPLNIVSLIIWVSLAPYYFFPLPWSSVYSLFFQLLALYFLILFIEKNKLILIFLSGISVSLTFWCRQSVGIFLFIFIFLFILFLKFFKKDNFKFLIKSLFFYLIGFFSVNIIFIIYFVISDSLIDWWKQSILFAFKFAFSHENEGVNNIFSNIIYSLKCLFAVDMQTKDSLIWRVFPIGNLILFFCNIIIFFKKKKLETKEIIILSVVFVSFAGWMQYFPVLENIHAYWAATTMVGLFVYLVWESVSFFIEFTFKKVNILNTNKLLKFTKENSTKINILKVTVVFIVFMLLFNNPINYRVRIGVSRLENNNIRLNSPKVLAGLTFGKDEAIKYYKLGKTIENLTTNFREKNLITIGPDALYLTFQENNQNFSPMYINWGTANSFLYPDYSKELDEYIKDKRPFIIKHPDYYLPNYYELLRDSAPWTGDYCLSLPLEVKNEYFNIFQRKRDKGFIKLNKEQIDALDDSLSQQITLYGIEKLDFRSLFFDNIFKLIPQSSKSDLWLNPLLENKISVKDILFYITDSKSLKSILAYYNDEEFLRFLYRFILNREADESGLMQWMDNLEKGMKREDIIKYFINSNETSSDEWRRSYIELSLTP